MSRVIRTRGPIPARFEVWGAGLLGAVGVDVGSGGAEVRLVLSPEDARRVARALLRAAAGDDFAGGEGLDHGDEMGPD